MNAVEIICKNCGKESFLNREALYEGFSKVGEKRTCASCGFVYTSEQEITFKEKSEAPKIFNETDRSEKITVFDTDENKQLCRYCRHYVVNPFTQFCGMHSKEVQATDSCPQFKKAEPKPTTNPPI